MKKIILPLIALALAVLGCSTFDDFEGIENREDGAEFALPVANARFSIEDLLDNLREGTNIFVDPDGTLRLNYKGDLTKKTADDLFKELKRVLDLIRDIPVLDTSMALPFTVPGGVDLDLIRLSSGKFIYAIQSPVLDVVQVDITFPNATKNGVPFQKRVLVLPFAQATDTLDLTGYDLRPINNKLLIQYKAINSKGESVVFPIGFFLVSFANITFSYLEGYFDQFVHQGSPDTIEIEFFENWIRGDVYFEDPTIAIYTRNSFGIPSRSIIHYFDVRTVKHDVLKLQSPYINNGVDFGYPKLPNEVGQVKSDTFVFNRRNSNIDVILGAGPEAVYYYVDALANPERDTTITGFVTDKSAYEVQVEVDLPLYGKVSGFAVRDTFDWNFSSYDEVKNAEFKVVTENGLGLEVGIQGYFLDDKNTVLDSLFTVSTPIVKPAPVDAQGKTTGKTKAETFAPFDAERFSHLKQAKRVLLQATFFTNDRGQTSVKVKKDQVVDMRMGMKLTL